MADASGAGRPAPITAPLSEPFWEGTRNGELRLQRCGSCSRFVWTPQYACPDCLSEDYEWVACSGRGVVYSYTVVHRSIDPSRFEAPYVLAVVQLEEGPHLLTNIVGCEPEAVQVDMPVELRFERIDDEFTVYPFAPREVQE